MIVVRCAHHLADAEPYRTAINALNLESARPDPFSTFEFYQHYLRNAERYPDGGGLRLWLLLAFSGDELIGYLALKQSTQRVLGVRASRLDLLTAYVADRPHVVSRLERVGEVSAAAYAYLLGRRFEWSLLEFEQQDGASQLQPTAVAALAALAPGSRLCRIRQWPNMSIGIIPMRWSSVAGYFAALSKKARSNVSRQMRTLFAAGDLQLLTASAPEAIEAIEALYELYRRIEPHSWKSLADADVGRTQQSVDFYAGLMHPSQPMRLVIQVLLLDGVPIAGLISGTFGRGFYALHIVYDERFSHLGPGSASLLLGMRLAIDEGCEFVNLLWGSSHFKTRWLAEMRETHSLQVYRVGTPYYWSRVLGDFRRRCTRRSTAEATLLFNPVRRALDARVAARLQALAAGLAPRSATTAAMPESTAVAPPHATPHATPHTSASERAALALLVERVRRWRGEFMSAAQLSAALPFSTHGRA
jgi:hypothetical protein